MCNRIRYHHLTWPALLAGGVLSVACRAGYAATDIFTSFNLKGAPWGMPLDAHLQLDDDGDISGARGSVSGENLTARVGDVDANWSELSFGQRHFLGIELGLPGNALQASIIGGRTLVEEDNTPISTPLYGVRLGKAAGSRTNVSLL